MTRGSAAVLGVLLAVAVITAGALRPTVGNGFVNWDDPDVVVDNGELQRDWGSVVAWAFTTRHMQHYQPLSWLAMAAVQGHPPAPARVHGASLLLHALNAAMVCWCGLLLVGGSAPSRDRALAPVAAGVAALLFAVHPLRVEPVAWASALPYLLSYALLLPSVACWLTWNRGRGARWYWAAVGLFALSQLARVTAPLMPAIFAMLAVADPYRTTTRGRSRLRPLAPLVAVALPLAIAEASARAVEGLAEVGVAARVASALTQPALYLWRTIVPVDLSPLDALPRVPVADWATAGVAVTAFAAIVALTARMTSWRVSAAVWASYLLLLLPVMGLTQSGVQATADRYTYGPGIVLALAMAGALVAAPLPWRRAVLVAGAAAIVPLAVASGAQSAYWHDSVSLWSRAVALDADNDVARYNLALAHASAGSRDAAIEQYQRLVASVPDHDLARRALARLLADREQAAADRAAQDGRLADAIAGYDRVLTHDPDRFRARANRGMALFNRGDAARAAPDLEAVVAAGVVDPNIAGALAYLWTSSGRTSEAIALLTRVQSRHPDDIGLANNLARLLLTAEPATLRDAPAALTLAARVNEITARRDPRLLGTLALALAATGRAQEAGAVRNRAIGLARAAGDLALVAALQQQPAPVQR